MLPVVLHWDLGKLHPGLDQTEVSLVRQLVQKVSIRKQISRKISRNQFHEKKKTSQYILLQLDTIHLGLRSANFFEEEEEQEFKPKEKDIDSSYSDPLGPAPERPRTSAGNRLKNNEDEFDDEEIGDDLLPE